MGPFRFRALASFAPLATLPLLLAPPAAAQGVTAFGLPHTALGTASLSAGPGGGLVVSNIGSSGLDGVEVRLPAPAQGWSAECDWSGGPGSGITYRAFGSGPGVPSQLATEFGVHENGGNYTATFTFTAAATARMRVYAGGALVHEETGVGGAGVIVAGQATAPSDCGRVLWGAIECTSELSFAPGTTFVTAGGVGVPCELLVMSPESPGLTFDRLQAMQLLPNQDLTLTDESLHAFGGMFTHAVGQAQFDVTSGGGLVVSNIGSSGLDGVRVRPPPVRPRPIFRGSPDNMCIALAPPDPTGTAPTGAQLSVHSTGVVSGTPGTPLGSVHVTRLASGMLQMSEDFGPIGATHVIVEVLNNGVQVASVTYPCPMGPVIELPEWPTGCGKRRIWYPSSLPCFYTELDQPYSMTLLGPNGGTVVGDEVRLLAVGGQGTLEGLEDLSVLAGDLGPLTVTGAGYGYPTPTTTYCTAKASLVCGPANIGAIGTSSATEGSGFIVGAAPVRALKSGLSIYGYNGRQAAPFLGGTLCFKPPVRRTVAVTAGGTPGTCEGGLSIDFNAFAQGHLGGSPAVQLRTAGTTIDAQFWFRDSLATGSGLSDAIEWVVGP